MRPLDRTVAELLRRRVRGAGRLAAGIYRGKPGRSVPAKLNGLRWEADPLDWLDQQVLAHGTYEPEITRLLIELVGSGGVLWDVGANAGVHALSVKATQPEAEVVAFEPSAAQYSRLLKNASLNGLEVQAFCIALYDLRGYRNLSIIDSGNSGHTSLVPWADATYAQEVPCWCDTGDDLVEQAGVPPPDVVKIDVEGAELGVLRGMARLLRRKELRGIVFEAPEALLSQAGHPVASLLTGAGFRIERLTSTGGGVDWLARRSE